MTVNTPPAETTTEPAEAPSELDIYKAQVRALALRLKEHFDWCDEETNRYLEELGLEPVAVPKTFTFTVKAEGTFSYTVRAVDQAAAESIVARYMQEDALALNYRQLPRNGALTHAAFAGDPTLAE